MVTDDIGVVAINYPTTDEPIGSSVTVSITLQNFGANTQNSIPVYFTIDGTVISQDVISTPLASLASMQYTFTTPYIVPNAPYSLCAVSDLAADVAPANDSLCANYGVTPGADDVGVSAILEPSMPTDTICAGEDFYVYDVIFTIENFGTNAQTSIPIEYDLAGTTGQQTWTGMLPGGPGTTVTDTIQVKFDPPFGNIQVCVNTNLQGDVDNTNDETCRPYVAVLCIGTDDLLKNGITLDQNIPNPTKDLTAIRYSVPVAGTVKFEITNLLGQVLTSVEETVGAGEHQLDVSTTSFAAGVYYYSIEFEGQRLVKKMIVTK